MLHWIPISAFARAGDLPNADAGRGKLLGILQSEFG